MQYHKPVLLQEVIDILSPSDNKIYLDATFGAGGYTSEILKQANCHVIAVDCDINAKKHFLNFSKELQKRCTFIQGNFSKLDTLLKNINIESIDGIVYDLGLSSMQIDSKERGFSFSFDSPLDMRMDQNTQTLAKDIINTLSEKDLANILYEYGGEKKSFLAAKNIVSFRKRKPIFSTYDLIKAITPIEKYYKTSKIHFATRTFQAIRITVNDELNNLNKSLSTINKLIKKDGIVCAVSFHSLEDKIVKNNFKNLIKNGEFSLINKKIITPSRDEIIKNNRSRSAKLRSIRRIL